MAVLFSPYVLVAPSSGSTFRFAFLPSFLRIYLSTLHPSVRKSKWLEFFFQEKSVARCDCVYIITRGKDRRSAVCGWWECSLTRAVPRVRPTELPSRKQDQRWHLTWWASLIIQWGNKHRSVDAEPTAASHSLELVICINYLSRCGHKRPDRHNLKKDIFVFNIDFIYVYVWLCGRKLHVRQVP